MGILEFLADIGVGVLFIAALLLGLALVLSIKGAISHGKN